MPQILRTVNDLILQSLYMSGELGVGETPDSFMVTTSLYCLNDMLNQFSSSSIYVPFLTKVNFTMAPNQQTYSISDIAPADIVSNRILDLTFANFTVQDSLIYPLRIINKAQYYNITRLNNLIARPSMIFLDIQATESFVTLYPIPDQPYPCEIHVKQYINSMINQDTMEVFVAPYFERFLRYALTRELKMFYPSANWTQEAEQDYQRMFDDLKAKNETDLTIRPSIIMVSPQLYYWQNILSY